MKAFASLHTAKPSHSTDCEVSYAGYRRVEIDWNPNFGRRAVEVVFPEITEKSDQKACFIAVSAEESGPGGIMQLAELIPNILLSKPEIPESLKDHPQAKQPYHPRICFANIPEPLPAGLHPIAAAAWHAINDRILDPASLPPKLFEELNNEFQTHGMEIMRVTREGKATMVQKIGLMRTPNLSDQAAGNA